MKKIILSAILILLGVFTLSAQDNIVPNVMTKGTNMGSIGIGLPIISPGYRMTIPPIAAFYEVGIVDLGRPGFCCRRCTCRFLGIQDQNRV